MSIRFALAPLLFTLLAACTAAPDGAENEPADESPAQVEVKVDDSASVAPTMRGVCECDLAAGSKVWKCNGQCSDKELRNLPH